MSEKKYVRNSEVVWNTVDQEIVILDISSGTYYGLNKTAAEIWIFLEKPRSEHEVMSHMHQTFSGTEEKKLDEDIITLLEDLLSKDLVISS